MEEFLDSPYLDPELEVHEFLRRYKRARVDRWCAVQPCIVDLAALMVCLLALERSRDAILVGMAYEDLARSKRSVWQDYRQRVLPTALYGATLLGDKQLANSLLNVLGETPLRALLKPRELLEHSEGCIHRVERPPKMLVQLCNAIVWLITDHIIFSYSLPEAERLQAAGIEPDRVSRYVDKSREVLKVVLEDKRQESILKGKSG